MGRKHSISRVYPVNAQVLWHDILDPNALAASMQGSLTYVGLPREPVFEGQRIVVTIRRWGWFPMGTWNMHVTRRDDQNLILESEEHGNLVRLYRHRLEVIPMGETEARYTDYLDLDAGIFTDAMFPMFSAMYEQRHEQRLKRLRASE
jgi:hypothetical protein